MVAEAALVSFASSWDRFEAVLSWLEGEEARGLDHAELESRLTVDARELYRQLFQDHLDLRAERECRIEEVVDAHGVVRSSAEAGHQRALQTVFGEVMVDRIAYRRRGHANLHPADAALNLPCEKHSHGLRRLAAVEASRGSFDDAVEAVERTTGQVVGKRQAEELAARAATDFEQFYSELSRPQSDPGDVLVMSADGKGIVMRLEALRKATARAAAKASTKLSTRLSKGEKPNRKRLAEVGAVYDAAPAPRTPDDIMASSGGDDHEPAPAPVAKNKWLMASVAEDAAAVVGKVFDEAERRDPEHVRTWVALVDGNNHQIDRIKKESKARKVKVRVVVDFVHVLEYLWKTAWCFFNEGDPEAEVWVKDKALEILHGRSSLVAAAIRRMATRRALDPGRRANADACADYLIHKRPYLDYSTALAAGWPIATGVIEGACRHLVKDRMDLTGARWGLDGAEAVLKLRAIRSNGDFDGYWRYHLAQERRRVHEARYADQAIPQVA